MVEEEQPLTGCVSAEGSDCAKSHSLFSTRGPKYPSRCQVPQFEHKPFSQESVSSLSTVFSWCRCLWQRLSRVRSRKCKEERQDTCVGLRYLEEPA